ncbi:pogo transposable element with ZNF domain [Synchiropus splendidus]|uniref:pogo transposable element with ZNF domain n=1 Tax=Synchiropus splendidus TaxID=270530 RepID=UPI00237EB206|nr:pogo transposable element with ZNF domain [Synchiropus splendidus]
MTSSSNMDTELFMECEEEELEPWQQVDDTVDEEEMDLYDSYCEPLDDSPPPSPSPPTSPPSRRTAAPAAPSSSQSPPPSAAVPVLTASVPPASPAVTLAQPLILTPSSGGTFFLPAVSGAGAQPILLTTQGFPVQSVMKPGTPLLLNLQPGQTVQPLTLIQSPPLGSVVRPGLGQTLRVPNTLTICSSPPRPINMQMTQFGVRALKPVGRPILPSGSANGLNRTVPSGGVSGQNPSAARPPDNGKIVMSVEEFYYGTSEGDQDLRKPAPLGVKPPNFTCQICSYPAANNLKLMQHMLKHSELSSPRRADENKLCKLCYRQFFSPTQLTQHQEQVHGPSLSSCMCRICEWAFENEPAFLNHMKVTHKPGEMPYLCQVCSYRSSFYADVIQHFSSSHRDSAHLMCVFCLKVTANTTLYQQHLLKHQLSQAFHCNKCRLQFIVLKDKMQHKTENHRSICRPPKLQGLPPGSKVTIRTYGRLRIQQKPFSEPNNIKTESRSLQPSSKKLSRKVHIGRSPVVEGQKLVCMECGNTVTSFSSHYPTYVHCPLCPYSSCCSRAYAAHMIHHHVPPSEARSLPLHKLPPPCPFQLHCTFCNFKPPSADHMADHLALNPQHNSATCRPKNFIERDIQPWPAEEKQPQPVQTHEPPGASWRSADSWKDPAECTELVIATFSESCGPHHTLPKNSDAIDFFNLLFPTTLVDLIADETNNHVKTRDYMSSSSTSWEPVTPKEIRSFIGLTILMGIQNLPDPAQYWSWSHYNNSYAFCQAMTFKRFKEISTNVRMGSFATEELRNTGNSSDPLHIFRPMLDILGGAMWKAYRPRCCLTIDRALLPSLEEESGGEVMGATKAPPQVWLLCDSKSGYCHRFHIEVGVDVEKEPGFRVVPQLVKGLEGKHHQLYLSNSLASVPLMQTLLEQKIYASSSFPSPSSIIPPELWDNGQLRNSGDFLQWQCGLLLATRWKDLKEMGCLSTNAPPGEADTVWRRSQTKVGGLDPMERPRAFHLLQENMRGVDICKQLLACNPLGGTLQDTLWRGLFWFLVNLSVVNSFIVLRESRRDNPPSWVRDGLFSQVNFRKRLGNQLARAVQKVGDASETTGKLAGEPGVEVHRVIRLGPCRRCKNCVLKNLRRESVLGCSFCRVNLCKQPSCFWEFHGLSPENRGSTKVGFIRNSQSGEVKVDSPGPENDMAPLEDQDFSDEERSDAEDIADLEDPDLIKPVKRPVSRSSSTSDQLLSPSAEFGDSLSPRQLRLLLSALLEGLNRASRLFTTDPQEIRSWLRKARQLMQRSKSVAFEGEEWLVAWVVDMQEQQLPLSESGFFHKVSALKKIGALAGPVQFSYGWAVNFLLQHHLGRSRLARTFPLGHPLPPSLEDQVKTFRKFVQKVVQVHKLPEPAVAAVDELCLFVDSRLVLDKTLRAQALELSGSSPLVTIYLAVLSDGVMLPTLVLANVEQPEKLPEFILLQSQSLQVEESLDLWTNKVWLRHLSSPTPISKSMLVLDQHREHSSDGSLTIISSSGTLPAIIPGGCSFCLQPLEVCIKPVLQRFLLTRWAQFVAQESAELEETKPQRLLANVTRLLVDWLVEFLALLQTVPQVGHKSFQVTELLLQEQESEQSDLSVARKLEIQSDLQRTLMELLPEDLELEEDTDSNEEPESQQETDRLMESQEEEKMDITEEGKVDQLILEREEVQEKQEDNSEEEEEEVEVRKETDEANKERRETRIVIGEEVGDEWKITVKSRMDGAENEQMDQS